MTRRQHRLGWVPPLLVGASAAVAAEVAIGILLYAGPGLMRSLTTVLAVEGAAFAAGLWSAPGTGPDIVGRIRRRWLFCLFVFVAAALFGTSWSVLEEIGGGSVSQTLGLALLAGFPLYACGSVLGAMGAAASTDRDGLGPPPGAAASMGAALGFVLTGALLPKAPLPSSLLVAGVVMLSLGGMVYGIVLGSRVHVDVRARRRSLGGEVRVEDRRLPPEDLLSRGLLEGEQERRSLTLEGESEVPWDVAVARATMVEETAPWRVLLVGGGASALPRSVMREHPTARVDVVERGSSVVELGREYMETELAVGVLGRAHVLIGNLDDRVGELSGPYDLAIVDTTALAGMGGVMGLATQTRTALLRLVGSEGVLVWGPAQPEAGSSELVDGRPRRIFRRGTGAATESLLVALPAAEGAWPERFDGFVAAGGGTDGT